MKHVAFVFPTMWDGKQLAACRQGWESRFRFTLAEPSDDDCPWDLDILSYIRETAERYRGGFARLDAVSSGNCKRLCGGRESVFGSRSVRASVEKSRATM